MRNSFYRFVFLLFAILQITAFHPLHARNIYLFGDSHQGAFTGIPGCCSALNDGITMHRVGRDRLGVLNIEHVQLIPGDAVLFSFGQIDVGWHICKQRDLTNRNLEEIIQTLAVEYIQALREITESHPDVIKIVYSIPPPSDIFVHQSLTIGYSGTLAERSFITHRLNDLLRELCPMNGLEFLDVYADYADELGYLRPELADASGYHIDTGCNRPIQTKLTEILENYSL